MNVPAVTLKRHWILLAVAAALASNAVANVNVTPATGGGNISADKAANAASPAWTSLGAIVIAEPGNGRGDIGSGTFILKAPAGFEFNTATLPSITFASGDITAAVITVTDATTLTAILTVLGSDDRDTLTIGGTVPLQIRPTAGTPLPNGNIYRPSPGGGTAVIAGVTATSNPNGSGGTSFGALSEVAGSAQQLALQTVLPEVLTAGQIISPAPVFLVQDQFGNTRNSANGAADNTTVVNAARGAGSGSLQGTTNVTAANGVVTFGNLSHNKAETITINFSSGSLEAVASGNIIVSPGVGSRLVFTTQPGGALYGTPLNPQPVVQTRDQFGNASTLGLPASRIVSLAITTGTGSLMGNSSMDIGTAAGNGTATFTNLQVSTAGSGKIMTASASGMTNGVSAAFTVNPVTVTGSITASNKIYDGTTAATIATRSLTGGVLGGESVSLTGGTANFADKNVGNGKLVTATGLTLSGAQAANYQLASTTATTSANITTAPLLVRADYLTRSYGVTNPPLTASYIGLAGGETLATSGITGSPVLNTTAQTTNAVGAYPITIASGNLAAQNYSFSFTNGVLTIAKAPLTVAANSFTRAFGTANPALTVTYSGFVLGQNSSVLSGNPSVTTTAVTNSPVGSYPIVVTAGSLTASNYAFNFVNGTLNVVPPGYLFGDDFTRAINPGPLAPWLVQAGNWQVTGGALVGGTNAAFNYGFVYVTNIWADYTASAQIRFSPGAYGGGLATRLNPATGARYAAWIYPEGSPGGSSVLKLLEFQNWTSFTLILQTNLPGVGTNWHTLKLAARGNKIAIHYDGALMLNWSDTEPAPLLNGGLSLDHWTDATAYTLTADDVLVTLPNSITTSNDTYTVRRATPLIVAAPGVLANDMGEMGGLFAQLAAGPANGTLSLSTNGGFTYTPVGSFTGTDTFTYRARDGFSTSGVTTVTITVTPNRAPNVTNNSYSLMANTTLTVPAPGILGNDSDPDGDSISALLATGPTQGTLTLNSNGSFTYVPNAHYTGSDSFTYRANDGLTNSSLATVSLTVTPFTSFYSDTFTRSSLSPWVVQAGNWVVNGSALKGGTNALSSYGYAYLTNRWTDFVAEARVQFTTNAFGGGLAGRLNSATGARYAAWIYPENSPGGSSVLKLLKFQDWASFSLVAQTGLPSVGTNFHTLTLAMQGPRVVVRYDGKLMLNYTDPAPLTDGGGDFDFWTDTVPTTMTADDLTVRPVRNVLATNDSYTLPFATTSIIAAPGVLTNDFSDMGSLSAILVNAPANGSLTLNPDGGFSYLPTGAYSGPDSFTYRATDGVNTSSPATVSITIPANRAPVANNNSYNVTMNVTLVVGAPGILANDTDADGNPLSAILASGPTHGILNLSSNGGFTFAPTAGYTGPDSFTYRANDGFTNSGLATVSLTVGAAGPLFTDDFTRTNPPGALSPWVVYTGNWSVTNGVLRGGTNITFTYGNAYLTNSWTDYEAQARVRFLTNGFGGGMAGRLDPIAGTRYSAWIYPENSPGGSSIWKLLKFQSWEGFTVMQQGSLPGVGTNFHTVKLSFRGGQIDFRYDSNLVTSVTDPSPYLSGGLSFDMWTDAAGYQMFADDVLVNALSAETPVTAISIAPNFPARTLTVTFQGAPGGVYQVQATTNLSSPIVWQTVATNVADGNGRWTFTDGLTNKPGRYYRTARP